MTIERTIHSLKTAAQADLQTCDSTKEIDALKIKYLGKKGAVQELMTALKDAPSAERPKLGKWINELKEFLKEALDEKASQLADIELSARLKKEALDISLPGRCRYLGNTHIALDLLDQTIDILVGMGFSVHYGPDVDSDYYNFEALNFSKDHPARDMHDTFYISSETLLRTHTSNTQVRLMEACKPPIRAIVPGKCFRNEDISARSHVIFHQLDGFYIDKKVTFADLLATLEEFYSKLMGRKVKMRFRPSYFPFVEPGIEVDMPCFICEGKGCSICKHTGWLEVAGAGMIHPEVLKSGGIDPEEYTGYAWGMGIERLAMLRYGISDIRLFWENRMSFLQQF